MTRQDIEIDRGDSWSKTLQVSVSGVAVALDAGTWQVSALEFKVKQSIGDLIAVLVTKSIGAGITLSAQSGTTLGQAVLALVPNDTKTLAGGVYFYDVVAVFTNGIRTHLIQLSKLQLNDVANIPP